MVVTLTSTHVCSVTVASSLVPRLRHLAGRVHSHGPRVLFELLCEIGTSSSAMTRIEAFANIDGDVLDRFGDRDLPPVIRIIK